MRKRIASIACLLFAIFSITCPVSARLATFDDYQFVNDTKIQASNWIFELDVADKSFQTPADGIILSYRFYDINTSFPINYISPVDILIGKGIVAQDPTKFNFTFEWGERYVNVSYESKPGDIDLVRSCIGNVHCIARNTESLQEIKSIINGSQIYLSGYLVNVTGTNGSSTFSWDTDTVFGNEQCEILVISGTEPSTFPDVSVGDLIVLAGLGVAILSIIFSVVVFHFMEKRKCRKVLKKVKIVDGRKCDADPRKT